ncbi:MAG: hypothetical protein JWO38_2049 [Gemmataceae bacterium]|nr:hypothetical protein [Gemmataceae bacterium]
MRTRVGIVCLVVPLCWPVPAAGEPPPEVPKEIRAPPGHKLVARLEAKGVQVYKAVDGMAGGPEWALDGPLAELADRKGRKAGFHYDGPAWEAMDGSKVVRDAADPMKSVPAPDPKAAIPWLLVRVKAADETPGAFAGVVWVQRVETAGGKAPTDPPKRTGTKLGVPYTAVYYLWAKMD